MTIDKINFYYPKGSLQSVFEGEALTALELASKTSQKVDECIELVNGVEQSAIEAFAIVDEMRVAQNDFITGNTDIRSGLIEANQEYIDGLNVSKAEYNAQYNVFKESLDSAKGIFEQNINTELQTFKTDSTAARVVYENALNSAKVAFDATMTANLATIQTSADTKLTQIETNATNKINQIETNANTVLIPEIVNERMDEMIIDGTLAGLVDITLVEPLKKSVNQKSINVKDFGAKGDNSANDTAAIKSAVAYLKTNGGGVLTFPVGTYLLGDSLILPPNIMLEGISSKSSIIKIKPNATLSGISYGGNQKIITNGVEGDENISIRNLGFDGNGAFQTTGMNISFLGVKNLTVENCSFYNFGTPTMYNQGFVVFGGFKTIITNCQFYNNSGDGFAVAEGAKDAIISKCLSYKNADYGIAVSNACENVLVVDSEFRDNGVNGIGIDECKHVVAKGNICENNVQYGIRVVRFQGNPSYPHHSLVLSDNILIHNGTGIQVEQAANISITGNVIQQKGGRGIALWSTKSFNISNNNIREDNRTGAAEGIFSISQSEDTHGDGVISGNVINNFVFGVRELTQGGTFNKSLIVGNMVRNNTYPLGLLFGLAENNDNQLIKGLVTWNPEALFPGTQKMFSFPVVGARIGEGDRVEIYPPYQMQESTVFGYVTATDMVTIILKNNSTNSNTFSSGVWGYKISRY